MVRTTQGINISTILKIDYVRGMCTDLTLIVSCPRPSSSRVQNMAEALRTPLSESVLIKLLTQPNI